MQSTASRDTAPEKKLRRALHKRGLRFRKDIRPVGNIRCKADIIFTKAKLCVFVDGCFWHGCPKHFKAPKTNAAWWKEKVEDNIARDKRKTEALKREGWKILRFWEHELAGKGTEGVVEAIESSLGR